MDTFLTAFSIADESGIIKMRFWNEQINTVGVDGVIQVTNVYVSSDFAVNVN